MRRCAQGTPVARCGHHGAPAGSSKCLSFLHGQLNIIAFPCWTELQGGCGVKGRLPAHGRATLLVSTSCAAQPRCMRCILSPTLHSHFDPSQQFFPCAPHSVFYKLVCKDHKLQSVSWFLPTMKHATPRSSLPHMPVPCSLLPHKHLMRFTQLVLWLVQQRFGSPHVRLNPVNQVINAAKAHLGPVQTGPTARSAKAVPTNGNAWLAYYFPCVLCTSTLSSC